MNTLHTKIKWAGRTKCISLLFCILFCLTASPGIFAQSLEMDSSTPSHMSSGVALNTTVSFTFNAGLDTDFFHPDQIHVYPDDAITIHDSRFSNDFKTLEFEVTHEPDTDYVWFFFGLSGLDGEWQEQYQVVNYSTATEVSDYTIQGGLSFVPDPGWMSKQTADSPEGRSKIAPEKQYYFRNFGHYDDLQQSLRSGTTITEALSGLKTLDSHPELLADNDDPVPWGLSMVWLLDDLEWMGDPQSGGPWQEILNAGVTDPETGRYTVENVRPGDYYIFALISVPGTEFDVFGVGLYEEDYEPAMVTVTDGSLTNMDITVRGWFFDVPEPIDAIDAIAPAVNRMADEDPAARPVEMIGVDSGFLFDDEYHKPVLDYNNGAQRVPSGKSPFWEVIFLNDNDSIIYFVLVMESGVVFIETMNISEIPPEYLPPIPLSELKTLPETFISSSSALQVALDNNLTELLDQAGYDTWDFLEYELNGFYFDFPDLLNEDSPVFWRVFYETVEWDYQTNIGFVTETNYLIHAEDGTLLGIHSEEYEIEDDDYDVIKVDLNYVFPTVQAIMNEENENARFVLSFGSEDVRLPDEPTGMSAEWMLVWFDFEEEIVYVFDTSGYEIIDRETVHLDDIPEDERPDVDFKPLEEPPAGSAFVVENAMNHGLREVLGLLSPDASVWVHYMIHSNYAEYPDILDETSDPFWDIILRAEVYNQHHQVIHKTRSSHILDAVTGEYLGSRTITPSEDIKEVPANIVLHQNYPNPFNPVTTIRWELDADRHVLLKVFDLLGREVAILIDQHYPAGVHSVPFDASGLPSGVYIYRLESGDVLLNKKMTIIK